MKKSEIIKKNKEFRRAYLKGASCASPCLAVYVVKNRFRLTRIGITSSKKIGNAVKRNRCRRVIREAFASLKENVKQGFDIVFVARGKTSCVKTDAVLKEMKFQLCKLGVLK